MPSEEMLPDADRIAGELMAALQAVPLPCALGGAIALGFWGRPRGTNDVDMNVFVTENCYGVLFDALEKAGCTVNRERALQQARDGECMVFAKDGMRVDIFVPSIPFDQVAASRQREVPFHGRRVSALDAESLTVYKLLFFRGKDRTDVEGIVTRQGATLDHTFVRHWLVELVGEDDMRVEEWDRIVREFGPAPSRGTSSGIS